jgi:hypothetical protein
MILLLILLIAISLIVPLIVGILKTKLNVPVKFQPLLPLGVGLAIGLILFLIPSIRMTVSEIVLFAAAVAGLGTIIYDFFSVMFPAKKV